MYQFVKIGVFAVVLIPLAACAQHGGLIPAQTQSQTTGGGSVAANVVQSGAAQTPAEINHWVPMFTTLPPSSVNFSTLEAQAAAQKTVPFFTGRVTSPLDHTSYPFAIVGKSPETSTVATNVLVAPIVLRIHFSDGTELDPTKAACGDTVSVADRFFKGPNFNKVPLTSNGINVGSTQITDGFQRAEFWSDVRNTGYHTLLALTTTTPLIRSVNAPSGSVTVAGVCSGSGHRIGAIDINAYDALVRDVIKTNVKATNIVPIILSYNTFETANNQCCVLGYHSAFSRSEGTQVYAIGAYNDPNIFNAPIEDIHAWTHEIGELFNDPFIDNATPAWGHIGQVSGCQNNLEVGDPLTGTAFTVIFNRFTYHPQELAFFDWFYRTPPEGTGRDFSFKETFERTQALCH